MLNNFIYAKTKALFEEKLNKGEILNEAIVFIEDTKEIWNHGHYFGGANEIPELNFDSWEEVSTEDGITHSRIPESDFDINQYRGHGIIYMNGGFWLVETIDGDTMRLKLTMSELDDVPGMSTEYKGIVHIHKDGGFYYAVGGIVKNIIPISDRMYGSDSTTFNDKIALFEAFRNNPSVEVSEEGKENFKKNLGLGADWNASEGEAGFIKNKTHGYKKYITVYSGRNTLPNFNGQRKFLYALDNVIYTLDPSINTTICSGETEAKAYYDLSAMTIRIEPIGSKTQDVDLYGWLLEDDIYEPLADGFIPNTIARKSELTELSPFGKGEGEGSAVLKGGNSAIGEYSVAEGSSTTASGDASHSEGSETTASKNASHAEGAKTTASGQASHAEGAQTTASGDASHAEGALAQATNSAAHAEGYNTLASGETSHAEGNLSKATGKTAHAEGYSTLAEGENSHAEGLYTKATALGSHAEGDYSEASGPRSHAEGYQTKATATSSHAEGNSTIAEGVASHAEGAETKALGIRAHAEGYKTVAKGPASHAEGSETKAQGDFSHAEGYLTTARGDCSHAEGLYTTASAPYSHAEGYYTTASTTYSHAEGYYTKTSNYAEHACGSYNASVASFSDKTKATQFSVGIGTSDNDRKNGLEVKQNGDIYINFEGEYVTLQSILRAALGYTSSMSEENDS